MLKLKKSNEELRICVLKRSEEKYIRLRIKREESQERTPYSFMSQVAFPLEK